MDRLWIWALGALAVLLVGMRIKDRSTGTRFTGGLRRWARWFANANHRWVVGGTVVVIGVTVAALGFAARDDVVVRDQVLSRPGTATVAFWIAGGLLTFAGVAVLVLPPFLLEQAVTITTLSRDLIARSVMAYMHNVSEPVVRLPEITVVNPPEHPAVVLILRLCYAGDYGAENSIEHTFLPRLFTMNPATIGTIVKPEWYDRCEYQPIVVASGTTRVFGVAFPLISIAQGQEQIGLALEVRDRTTGRSVRLPEAAGTASL